MENRRIIGCRAARVLLALWLGTVAALTLSDRVIELFMAVDYVPMYHLRPIPFQTIGELLSPHANLGYSLLALCGNIVMFMPFGFLFPLCFRRTFGFLKTFGCGAALSAAVELIQFFIGRTCDVDDLILNSLGAALGWLLFYAAQEFRTKKQTGEAS